MLCRTILTIIGQPSSKSGGNSIKVDLTKGYPNSVVMFTYRAYVWSRTSAVQQVYQTKNNPTVGDIYRLITTPDSSQRNERLDRYNLSADGLGCSFWLYRLILRLENAGYLEDRTAEHVWNFMQFFYINGQVQYPAVINGERYGTFYYTSVMS
jgi:hypothetical protein